MSRDRASPRTVKVWDPVVRIGHWLLVVSVTIAWLSRSGWGEWHERIGYAALAIGAFRVLWGSIGPEHARFADFVRGPRLTLTYAVQVAHGNEPRYVGHNPLGGWMIVGLLGMVILVGLTGWLYTTDRYWGVEWVENLHHALAKVLLALIPMHVVGALYASHRHRENLIAAMVHGRKRQSTEQ
jgi:cytochrome b